MTIDFYLCNMMFLFLPKAGSIFIIPESWGNCLFVLNLVPQRVTNKHDVGRELKGFICEDSSFLASGYFQPQGA